MYICLPIYIYAYVLRDLIFNEIKYVFQNTYKSDFRTAQDYRGAEVINHQP